MHACCVLCEWVHITHIGKIYIHVTCLQACAAAVLLREGLRPCLCRACDQQHMGARQHVCALVLDCCCGMRVRQRCVCLWVMGACACLPVVPPPWSMSAAETLWYAICLAKIACAPGNTTRRVSGSNSTNGTSTYAIGVCCPARGDTLGLRSSELLLICSSLGDTLLACSCAAS